MDTTCLLVVELGVVPVFRSLTGVVVIDSRHSPVGSSEASHGTIGKFELREVILG